MTIKFNMLCTFMKNRIFGNVNCCLSVIIYRELKKWSYNQILKKSNNPSDLGHKTTRRAVRCFSGRKGNDWLFFYFQDIEQPPRLKKYPLTYHRELKHASQSESQKTWIWKEGFGDKKYESMDLYLGTLRHDKKLAGDWNKDFSYTD